ncbi:MAG: hypothetical protein EBV06_05940 [Planctomycetia bacterium]|nr:hypothetical protein [Planctomycetia bacterium]
MSEPPKGRVVGRVAVTRLCGCKQEFEQLAGDRFSEQRLAKFRKSRCPVCAAKYAEEQKKLALPKAEAYKNLPAGTVISLVMRSDGQWVGRLSADGRVAETRGQGLESTLLTIARQWLAGRK